MADAIWVKPSKDVFWTSNSNPGNAYYYDCMEVSIETDPNSPWPINYRYVGQITTTGKGQSPDRVQSIYVDNFEVPIFSQPVATIASRGMWSTSIGTNP